MSTVLNLGMSFKGDFLIYSYVINRVLPNWPVFYKHYVMILCPTGFVAILDKLRYYWRNNDNELKFNKLN